MSKELEKTGTVPPTGADSATENTRVEGSAEVKPLANPVLDHDALTKLFRGALGQNEAKAAGNDGEEATAAAAGAATGNGEETPQVEEEVLSQGESEAGPEGAAEAPVAEPEGKPAEDELPRSVAKRLHKQAEKYEAELSEMRSKLERLEAERAKAAEAEPKASALGAGTTPAERIVAAVDDPAKLEALKTEARQTIQWCRRNANGGTYAGQELDAEQVANLQDVSEDVLFEKADRRIKFIQAHQEQHAFVKQTFAPHLDDASHAETQAVKSVLANVPGLRDRADAEYWALAAVRGHALMQAQHAAKAKGTAAPRVAPRTAGVPVAAPRKANEGDAAKAQRDRAFKGGDERALVEFVKAQLLAGGLTTTR